MMIGDVVAKVGRRALLAALPAAKKMFDIDFAAANGENLAHGFGITEKTAGELFRGGVDLITGGNHTWDRKEVVPLLESAPIIRPLNYPFGAAGKGIFHADIRGGKLAVINLLGFMGYVDNPFNAALRAVDELRGDGIKHIVIDFHAETTSEKNSLLKLLEGRISALCGTHTHIGTDDLLIANGTGYVSDIGLTGIRNEVIGMCSKEPISRFTTGIRRAFEACEGELTIFQAVIFELDDQGRCMDAFKIKSFDGGEIAVSMRRSPGW
ncbi:MAG: YmdB family metallophosphoesterase [Helicobacteraceae bacterium]|jgi:metallophosphoesterase (TIGR00282 family)|nr:YmdB family metallophosphoesterase [Helicobacteraceae bacterium]